MVETHISWVFLTGKFAYKIKKPVNFGFLDFSSLEKRHQCCLEEIRLNSRLAPNIYIDVIAIGRSDNGAATLQSVQKPVEYAVRMHQFDDSAQFDLLLAENQLTTEHIDKLADTIAAFHQNIDIAAPETAYGTFASVTGPMLENFDQVFSNITDHDVRRQVRRLEAWTKDKLRLLSHIIQQRKDDGFVRECHGDLHLRNIAWVDHAPLAFDCIEFNPNLRWIDTCSEIAFLVMDLQDRGRRDFADRFLNRYLELTGDYNGLPVLLLYLVYRAMVRAKVAALRLSQATIDKTTSDQATIDVNQQELATYLSLATSYIQPRKPLLIITHGLSGSGKSTLAATLAESIGAIRIRSDVERKRLVGIPLERQAATKFGQGIYTSDISERTYNRLTELAQICLNAEFSCIVDATFLQDWQRDKFRFLADKLAIPFYILQLDIPIPVLEKRLNNRRDDVSEARSSVLQHQINNRQVLTKEELKHTITWHHDKPLTLDQLVGKLSPK